MEYMSCVELDVHGMTQAQAEIAIEAKLRRAKGVYRIRVIHGYTRGTALRVFIRSRYRHHPRGAQIRETIGFASGEATGAGIPGMYSEHGQRSMM